MSNYKILYKVTGSIAAYKSAFVISKLVQFGCEVKVVASETALKFVGKATYEGLTGNQVYTDSFADGEMMSHINLVKWADLTIIAPATANTINKLAAGIADTLLTSLFLAHDRNKPYLIAPAMNTNMFTHPSTQEAIAKLKNWGVIILPTEVGYLACGDVGEGKFINPDSIFEKIIDTLTSTLKPVRKKNILVTYGGTSENIDGVRKLANMSTGKTGSTIAEHLTLAGYNITLLRSNNSIKPKFNLNEETFSTFVEYETVLLQLLSKNNFDFVLHLAALSDYSPTQIELGDSLTDLPLDSKFISDSDSIKIVLKKNPKIISNIKSFSKNKDIKVIGFKLTRSNIDMENHTAVNKLFADSNCDFVVHNDLGNRNEKGEQQFFTIYDNQLSAKICITANQLAKEIEKIIMESE